MTRISVIGGTGYAGGHIVHEAVRRGHQVTAYSRRTSETPVPGAKYVEADVLADGTLQLATADADVVISALSPRGPMAGRTRRTLADLATLAAQRRVRLGVIGGAGTLRVGDSGPLVKDTDDFPVEFKAEAEEMGNVLDDLKASAAEVDWFYVSPAGHFGAWAPGQPTGTYRIGGDQLLTDQDGNSELSGPDLAHAVLTEVETPTHRRTRFSVAY